MNLDYITQVQHKGAAELVKVQQKMQVMIHISIVNAGTG